MDRWSRTLLFKVFFSLLLAFAFLFLFLPLAKEILLAAVFAFALYPVTQHLIYYSFFRRQHWVILLIIFMFLVLVVPLGIASYKVVVNLRSAFQGGIQNTSVYTDVLQLKDFLLYLFSQLNTYFQLGNQLDWSSFGDDFINQAGQVVMTISGNVVYSIPNLLLSLFVFCCALFYFLDQSDRIYRLIGRLKLLPPDELRELVSILQKSSASTVFVSFIVGAIQACVVTVGGLIFQTGDPVVVFVVTFFASFIPVIGAGPVAGVMGLLNLIKGSYGPGVGLIVVGVIAGTIDNFIRPWLVSSDRELHPVLALLAIIGAIIVFGFAGLFLGPVLALVTFRFFGMLLRQDIEATSAKK